MKNYFEMLDKTIKEYFKILSDEIPDFLNEYINTKEMQKQSGISVSCGTYYTKLFDKMIWYSSLDHSIAVSLIVWNFTKDKKQTLAGLFHDIATPVFKHSIDFMNGDYEKQESTEELTTRIINESQEIMKLLKRDGIKVEEVDNYHIYPIADNDTPMLSADRLEYTLSNGLGVRKKVWNLNDIKEIYDNIEVQKNEQGIDELGFKDKTIAEKFVKGMRILSNSYIDNKTKLSMQFLADIMKNMSYKNLITKKDLYELSEKEVIEKIENCNYKDISKKFNFWKNAYEIKESDKEVKGKYCVNINAKIRYINPLVKCDSKFCRIYDVSNQAKEDIENFKNMKMHQYIGFEFNFKPECTEKKRSHVCKIARKKSGIKCAKKITIFIVIFFNGNRRLRLHHRRNRLRLRQKRNLLHQLNSSELCFLRY